MSELLLDQTQIDYRDTLVEVAKEYPSTKQQLKENKLERENLT